jgi:hypothetical protein
MAVGAALVFVLGKVARGGHLTSETVDAKLRHLRNRARGIAAETLGRLRSDAVDDDRLRERVRSKLGRVCSHPRAIEVYVSDGEVTLLGPALADEVRTLLTTAASVRGVHAVVNDLEPHDSPDGVPALQGDGRLAGSRFDLQPQNWAPATRALVSVAAVAAGGLAIAYARR